MNIALIPARSGSKRLPGKNIRNLNGLPLIYYSIKSAISAGVFSEILVSTDSEEIASLAKNFGAEVPLLRPHEISLDSSPDIAWVEHALKKMVQTPAENIENIAILRPTNPLRTGKTISTALDFFRANSWADSLRAMERTFKHPGKMWLLNENNLATPFLLQRKGEIPTHDCPTQVLQKVWIQNASLEIIKKNTIVSQQSISGEKVIGFEMPWPEGYDVNDQTDLEFLEYMIAKNPKLLSP